MIVSVALVEECLELLFLAAHVELEVPNARAHGLALLARVDHLRRQLLLAQQQPLELAMPVMIHLLEGTALTLVAAVALAARASGSAGAAALLSWVEALKTAGERLDLVVEQRDLLCPPFSARSLVQKLGDGHILTNLLLQCALVALELLLRGLDGDLGFVQPPVGRREPLAQLLELPLAILAADALPRLAHTRRCRLESRRRAAAERARGHRAVACHRRATTTTLRWPLLLLLLLLERSELARELRRLRALAAEGHRRRLGAARKLLHLGLPSIAHARAAAAATAAAHARGLELDFALLELELQHMQLVHKDLRVL